MTDFERYFTAILDGEIMACEKMKKVSEMLLENFVNPGEYHFDAAIAERHVSFIEQFCKIPTGRINTPLKLELFQKARLQAVFGFVDDNNYRQYNECLIVEGRKNGKTTETAAVEIDMLVNDGEGSPQIYNVATMLEQAKLGFNAALKMIRQSKELLKHVKKRASDLYFAYNMGFIKALASNTNSLDGLDVHCGVIDELAAIKNRDIYDLVKQAMGARMQPLLFCITTNGFVRNGIFDSQYDYATAVLNGEAKNDKFLPFIYELDDYKEWTDESKWVKANPGLGTIKQLSYLREMVQKAKDDESFKPTVLVKDFNLKQNKTEAWLPWNVLDNTEKIPDYAFRYGIGGIDAADSVDLNAAVCICRRRNDPKLYVKSMFWLPEKAVTDYEMRGNRRGRDSVPYRTWAERGLLRLVPGARVDKRVFLEWFNELREKDDIYIQKIGYDPWHIDDSLLRDFKNLFGEKSMIPVRQGVFTLSAPMKEMKCDLDEKLIVYDDNPIMKWCLANMHIKVDTNGNIQPVKGIDARQRIDGGMALTDAYIVYRNEKTVIESLI